MLRFGVLGTGYWADVCHATGLAAHPDAELVGIWGRDPAKAAALAARHGVAAEAELEALLEKVDAVSVAVPPDVQAELAVRAAEAERHLLLEKPLALSTAAADRVAETVADAGVASVVFFLLRFRDEVETWLSDVVGPSTWEGGSALFLNSALAPESPFSHSRWRHEHGALWDLVPHHAAVLIPALGPVQDVLAARGPRDTVHVVFRHDGGAVSDVTASLTTPAAAGRLRLELWGEAGFVEAPLDLDYRAPYARAVSALVSAVETGVPDPCDAAFGAEVVRVVAAAERFAGVPA